MARVADHLSVAELGERYRSCVDVTAARHLQTIWLLAKGHEIATVATTTAFAPRWSSASWPATTPEAPTRWAICGAGTGRARPC